MESKEIIAAFVRTKRKTYAQRGQNPEFPLCNLAELPLIKFQDRTL
jgi:hypothetical protein